MVINRLSRIFCFVHIWVQHSYNTSGYLIGQTLTRRGKAYISSLEEYCDGARWRWQNEPCVNDQIITISKGLDMAIEGKPYDLIDNNCQVFTNRACHNSGHSQDVNKWIGIGLGVLTFSLILNALTTD